MKPLPKCSDLVQRGYTTEAIKVIQEADKCADEIGITLQSTPARNEFIPLNWNTFTENLSIDPLVLLGFLIGVALAFGSKSWNYLGVSRRGGRHHKP